MLFGQLLTHCRNATQTGLAQLGKKIGVTTTYVARVEGGVTKPLTQGRILVAANAMGIDPATLLLAAAKQNGIFLIPDQDDPIATRAAMALLQLQGAELHQELQRICESMEQDQEHSPYGYCPHCKRPGLTRERRPNGDDTCEAGHKYPSASALKKQKGKAVNP